MYYYIIIKVINMDTLKHVLLWIWQSPQNILAILITLVLFKQAKKYGKYRGNRLIYTNIKHFGASFGDYIFINSTFDVVDLDHESGHSRQSELLGPLYLFIIGIPSVIHWWVRYIMKQFGKRPAWNYYDFYTEKWADKWGGVDPKFRYKKKR